MDWHEENPKLNDQEDYGAKDIVTMQEAENAEDYEDDGDEACEGPSYQLPEDHGDGDGQAGYEVDLEGPEQGYAHDQEDTQLSGQQEGKEGYENNHDAEGVQLEGQHEESYGYHDEGVGYGYEEEDRDYYEDNEDW